MKKGQRKSPKVLVIEFSHPKWKENAFCIQPPHLNWDPIMKIGEDPKLLKLIDVHMMTERQFMDMRFHGG